jgi:hypothetical protein
MLTRRARNVIWVLVWIGPLEFASRRRCLEQTRGQSRWDFKGPNEWPRMYFSDS